MNVNKEPRTFSLNKNYHNITSKDLSNLESKKMRIDNQRQYKIDLDNQVLYHLTK